MANYGEELVYWYLRFNGFFPITNYVVHQSQVSKYRSDVDILAVRFPNVCEEVGGQQEDWDPELQRHLDFTLTLGLMCEVKTGPRYKVESLFPTTNISHSVKRLGLFADTSPPIEALHNQAVYTSTGQSQIAKLLIARSSLQGGPYFSLSITHVRGFIKRRLIKYRENKLRDRMSFPSAMLQEMIAEVDA